MESIRDINAEVKLDLSAGRFEAQSVGGMHLGEGEVQIKHSYSSPLLGFNPHFLTAAALTGTPAPARLIDGADNPFKDASGFSFDRDVQFSNGQRAQVVGKYELEGNSYKGSLHVSGELPDVMTTEVLPTVEVWRISDKEITGSFLMTWKASDGTQIDAVTRTIYHLNNVDLMKFPNNQYRYITIQSGINGNDYLQDEQISLIGGIPAHVPEMKNLRPLVA
ncbi:MAG: hypothetical protein ABIS51_03565 [Sphingomonas sp.]